MTSYPQPTLFIKAGAFAIFAGLWLMGLLLLPVALVTAMIMRLSHWTLNRGQA